MNLKYSKVHLWMGGRITTIQSIMTIMNNQKVAQERKNRKVQTHIRVVRMGIIRVEPLSNYYLNPTGSIEVYYALLNLFKSHMCIY